MAQDAATRFRIANRIEIRDGTVSFVDLGRAADEPPLRLELVQLEAERNWLSDAGSLSLAAVVVDGRNAPFPISFDVRREEDRPFRWDLSWQGVSLRAARQLVPSLPLLAGLTGRWSGALHVTRDAPDQNTLTLSSTVEDASLVLPRSQDRIAYDRLDFEARIELDRKEVRVRKGKLGGNRIRSDFEATLDRPLRPASRTRLETRLVGVEFEDVRSLVDSLESEFQTARSMYRLVERVDSGRIQQIEASGTATLRDWQALWRGPERELPEGFLLSRYLRRGERRRGLDRRHPGSLGRGRVDRRQARIARRPGALPWQVAAADGPLDRRRLPSRARDANSRARSPRIPPRFPASAPSPRSCALATRTRSRP